MGLRQAGGDIRSDLKHDWNNLKGEGGADSDRFVFFGTVLVNILIMGFFQFDMPYGPNNYSLIQCNVREANIQACADHKLKCLSPIRNVLERCQLSLRHHENIQYLSLHAAPELAETTRRQSSSEWHNLFTLLCEAKVRLSMSGGCARLHEGPREFNFIFRGSTKALCGRPCPGNNYIGVRATQL